MEGENLRRDFSFFSAHVFGYGATPSMRMDYEDFGRVGAAVFLNSNLILVDKFRKPCILFSGLYAEKTVYCGDCLWNLEKEKEE